MDGCRVEAAGRHPFTSVHDFDTQAEEELEAYLGQGGRAFIQPPLAAWAGKY